MILACNGSHNEIARIAKRILGNRIAAAKSTNGKLLWYVFDGRWKTDVDAIHVKHELSTVVLEHFIIVMNIERASQSDYDMQRNDESTKDDSADLAHITARLQDATFKNNVLKEMLEYFYEPEFIKKLDADRLAHITARLQDATFKNNVLQEMLEYFYDPDFMKKLDADPNLLGFNNGVWDLKNGVFRQGHPEDMVSMSVGFDYNGAVCAESADRVRKYWDTMHPDIYQREYLIHTFARQLYGDSGQELFHIHAGANASASNGKTKFFEVMEIALGDYIRKFGVEMLTSKQRNDPGRPMPEFATWKGVRIMYCTEPNHDEVLNSGVLKDMTTGGEGITHRLLHSSDIVHFRPQHKIHIMCNSPPIVDGSDSGVQRRIRKLDYISRFVDADEADAAKFLFPRDTGLVEAFKADDGAMRMEFLRTLLHAFVYEYKFDIPDSLKKTSAMYLNANDDALAMFVEEHVSAAIPATVMDLDLERHLREDTDTDLVLLLQQETDLERHLIKRKTLRGM
jgi:phage/plasmid-associated DNA primase